MGSCGKKGEGEPDLQLNAATVDLRYDQTHQFSVTKGASAMAANTFTWTSTDQTVGTVSTGGLFTAKKIGQTTINGSSASGSVTAKVTVTPYSTMVKEPYFDPTATIATTKSKETRTLVSQDGNTLLYNGENANVRNVIYLFENGQMTQGALLLANTNAVVQEFATFIKERYNYLGDNGAGVYVYSDNKNVTVGIGADATLGFYALYIKYSGSARGSIKAIEAVRGQQLKQLSGLVK